MSKVADIVNFSSVLPEDNSHNFNPTVAHWKDDLYLCAYRNFTRNKDYKDAEPLDDPNHPWLGGPGSSTWWGGENKKDHTGFAILKIRDTTITNVKSLNDGESLEYINASENFSKNQQYLEGVDARLLKLPRDKFLLSFNVYERDRKRGSGFAIYTSILKITEDMKLLIYKPTVICPEISQLNEKNWSFWLTRSGKLKFSYNLAPNHIIYDAHIKKNVVYCDQTSMQESIGYFGILEEKFNTYFKIGLHISLTTPAIPRKGKNTYIGVGHVKYQWDKVNPTLENHISKFQRTHGKYRHHPSLDYFMFFYEFNPSNGNIISISDMFIPSKTKYLLAFPSGLTYLQNGKLAVFYGDYDSFSKMLVITDETLNGILKSIRMKGKSEYKGGELFHAWNSIWPNPKFFIFPENCIDAKEICSVLI